MQRGRIENLLAQQQEILARQKAEGATAYDIQKTEANIRTLQKKLAAQQGKLNTAENTPTLQRITQKNRSRLLREAPTPTAENSRKNVLDISTKIDRIKAEGKIIIDGSHIKNGKLQPNVTYQTGEHAYIYQTNEDGLIELVYAEDLQFKTHEGRLDHDPKTYGKLPGDHAGHLIADRFGGSPKLDNLVSQAASVNQKTYRKLEDIWASAQKAGKKVSVGIAVNYETGSSRPISFDVVYKIDGVSEKICILNS